MGRSRIEDRNTRKIFKTGGATYAVTLPIDIIRDFNWQERQKVVVTADKNRKRIIIEDWEK